MVGRYKAYEEYKESGVEYLGPVPVHWRVSQIKRSVDGCVNGIWGGEPLGSERDTIVIRVADFERDKLAIKNEGYTWRYIEEKDKTRRSLRTGDLLLEKSGGGEQTLVGQVVLFDKDFEAVTSNFVAKMTPVIGFSSKYLNYVFARFYSQKINYCSIKQNTGIQNLDSGQYLSESFAFPLEPEQQTIANFLDHETAKIDTLIDKQQQLIKLLKEKRLAVISHTVTKGLNPDAPMKDSGVEWLGKVPEHWGVSYLNHLVDQRRKIMYGIVLPGPNVDVGVPIVKGGDVKPGRLNLGALCKTTFDIESNYERSRLREGDLVYSIRGTIGDVQIVPREIEGANLTQDAARIAPANGVLNTWLCYVMESYPIFSQLEIGSLGAAVKGINIRDLKKAYIPLPPESEQREIAARLDSLLSRLDQLEGKASEQVVLLQERRAALISAAVTGRIDVRNWQREQTQSTREASA